MKRTLVSPAASGRMLGSALLLYALLGASSATGQEPVPADVVSDVVEAYYEAAADADMATAKNLTHVDAKLFGARNDKLMQTPLTLWPARSGVDMASVQIGIARVVGVSAVVEVTRASGGETLVEQVSLVRFNGAWRLISIVQGVAGR